MSFKLLFLNYFKAKFIINLHHYTTIAMQIYRYLLLFILLLGPEISALQAQEKEKLTFFTPADTFHTKRFWTSFGAGAAAYTASMIGLNQIWYAEYPRGNFHLFNDWREWEKMDKIGHALTTYHESRVSFEMLRWSGMKRRKAAWVGIGVASFFQASLETLDGYSDRWGFSIYDITFNTIGAGVFLSQEFLWEEQRILFKLSSSGVNYPEASLSPVNGGPTTTLEERITDLYGQSWPERFIKDYNGQTLWLSVNPHSFLPPTSRFPAWLNVALGYGAQNLYGGFDNSWDIEDSTYELDPVLYPRYHQFYLSFDVDLTKIKTKSRFLRMLLKGLNFVKIPAPALEFNDLGKVKFHPLHF